MKMMWRKMFYSDPMSIDMALILSVCTCCYVLSAEITTYAII